jgi:hypothetical protein
VNIPKKKITINGDLLLKPFESKINNLFINNNEEKSGEHYPKYIFQNNNNNKIIYIFQEKNHNSTKSHR